MPHADSDDDSLGLDSIEATASARGSVVDGGLRAGQIDIQQHIDRLVRLQCCSAKCLQQDVAATTRLVRTFFDMTSESQQASLLTTLACCSSSHAGEGSLYYIPMLGNVCQTAFQAAHNISNATLDKYRLQISRNGAAPRSETASHTTVTHMGPRRRRSSIGSPRSITRGIGAMILPADLSARRRSQSMLARLINPFPEVHLSEADKDSLRDAASMYMRETRDQFEDFIRTTPDRRLPAEDWSVVHREDDIRVYLKRTPSQRCTGSKCSVISVIGTAAADLDNCMFGSMTLSLHDLLVNAAYGRNEVANASLLAVLDRPTQDAPFQGMNVQWVVAKAGRKAYDTIYLFATGIAAFSNGERVGYRVAHSIDIAALPVLRESTRIQVSIVSIWRQHSPTHVEVYSKCFLNDAPTEGVQVLMQNITSSIRMARLSSEMKKLAWVVKHHADEYASSGRDGQAWLDDPRCRMCSKDFLSMLSEHSKRKCDLCCRAICTSCRIRKTLYEVDSKPRLRSTRISVCKRCLDKAIATDAIQTMQEQLAELEEAAAEVEYTNQEEVANAEKHPAKSEDDARLQGDASSSIGSSCSDELPLDAESSLFSSVTDPDSPGPRDSFAWT